MNASQHSPSHGKRRLKRLRQLEEYVERTGWLHSAICRRPLDGEGRPIPWYTYGCTRFLQERAQEEMRVLEFGSGFSTLWWAERVGLVDSIEHNADFVEEISRSAPTNVIYHYRSTEDGSYVSFAGQAGKVYHIIVVDGEERVRCGVAAVDALREDGVVVWDNANRRKYAAGYEFLRSHGFRRIDFYGHGPIWVYEWSTAIFYRDGNCLGI